MLCSNYINSDTITRNEKNTKIYQANIHCTTKQTQHINCTLTRRNILVRRGSRILEWGASGEGGIISIAWTYIGHQAHFTYHRRPIYYWINFWLVLNTAYSCLQLTLEYWLYARVIKIKSNSISALENARRTSDKHKHSTIWGTQGGQTFERGHSPWLPPP